MRAQILEPRWLLDPEQLASARQHAMELANHLARMSDPRQIADDLGAFVDEIRGLSEPVAVGQPLLAGSLFNNAIELAKAIGRLDDPQTQENANLSVHSIAQLLELLSEEVPAGMAEVEPKAAIRWLADTLRPATQPELADLLGVGERTLQHWLSPHEAASPSGQNLERLRRVLLMTARLRPMFTAQGLLEWLRTPIPALGRRSPATALESDEGFARVMRVAAELRSI
jgi:hypothetical protein